MVTRMKYEELLAFGEAVSDGAKYAEQQANMAYLQQHYKQLLRDYPNHWVIVQGGGQQVFLEGDPNKYEDKLEETRAVGGVTYFLAYPEAVMLL